MRTVADKITFIPQKRYGLEDGLSDKTKLWSNFATKTDTSLILF